MNGFESQITGVGWDGSENPLPCCPLLQSTSALPFRFSCSSLRPFTSTGNPKSHSIRTRQPPAQEHVTEALKVVYYIFCTTNRWLVILLGRSNFQLWVDTGFTAVPPSLHSCCLVFYLNYFFSLLLQVINIAEGKYPFNMAQFQSRCEKCQQRNYDFHVFRLGIH